MDILYAKNKDLQDSLEIARNLKEWFTKDALENMQKDFFKQNLFVAINQKVVVGFLCFSKKKKYFKILWIGVKKRFQGKGVGTNLLNKLIELSKKSNINSIKVETLTEKEDYKPYILTRAFYYRNGFKKIAIKLPKKAGWDIQDVLEKKLK